MRAALVVVLLLACSNLGVSDSSIEVRQGEVSVPTTPPNPKNIRGVVFISASRAAALGKQRVNVSADGSACARAMHRSSTSCSSVRARSSFSTTGAPFSRLTMAPFKRQTSRG